MSFSLADFTPQVAKMELIHPTGVATGVYLNLVGQDSKAFRDASKKLMKSRLNKKEGDVDLDQMETDNAELASLCIVGWSDDEALGGTYSPQYAKELMLKPEYSWIREEVEAFVRERSNFFRRAAPAALESPKASRKAKSNAE